MKAEWYIPGEAEKAVTYVGTHRVVDPVTGKVTLRPYFRAQGASDEEYPHDADSGD